MFTGREIDLIVYALSYLRASVNRDVLNDIKDSCKGIELAQGELKTLEQQVAQLPQTTGKPLPERLQLFIRLHIFGRVHLVAYKSQAPVKEVFEYQLDKGPDVMADRFINWGRDKQYAGKFDTPFYEEMAALVEDNREEVKAFIVKTVQEVLDLLPEPQETAGDEGQKEKAPNSGRGGQVARRTPI
jgi:hypothetical protein